MRFIRAALYKSYGETTDAVKAGDVTVPLVREARPEKQPWRNVFPDSFSGVFFVKW